ncbi:MAG TPA: DNA polymerase III subunit gamma/tau [Gemmatimonadales bacterium]|nr:DNA polymerase III subunit gamma/tau [Gemmatimonadales bacterium]
MIALARRYRPKRFADLLVQDHVAAVLRGAVARGRVGHGYLLTGPRGVGKTTAARILAMALNCPNRDPSGDPCGECDDCVRIWTGAANLDVVEIDAASNRGVDDARELRERAMYAASQAGHHKVYIVDEAHMLTREAWNALLKILEEPPPGVVFVFATTEPQKIAATAAPVLSRLQRFDFRRIGPAAIRTRLRAVLDAEGIGADEDALTLIARHADGGMRDALSVLDQCLSLGEGAVTAARVREVLGLVADDLFAETLDLVAERNPGAVFPLIDRLVDAGADLVEFMGGAGEALRAMLMLQLGTVPEGLTEGLRQALERYRERLSPEDLVRMLRLLTDSEAAVRRSANPRLVVETLLLRWAMMDRTVDLEAVLAGGTSSPPAPARPSPRPAAPRRPGPESAPERASGAGAAPRPDAGSRTTAPTPPVASTPSSAPLADLWPDVVAEVRTRSRFLGEALAATTPGAVQDGALEVVLGEANPLFAERLQSEARSVEDVIRRLSGQAVRLKVTERTTEGSAGRPRQLTEASLKADRLRGFRAKDPSLDTAADALDLEIVDEV